VELHEYHDARRAFEAALDIQRNALSQEPANAPLMFGAATTLCNLGYLYKHRGMPAKTGLVLLEAANLLESILGRTHPTVLSTLDSLADAYAANGQTSDALALYAQLLERSNEAES
jgi:tetratricopeptide (TPR) repeat protein